MSGTSLDGVDAVLARFDTKGKPVVLARAASAFDPSLRETLFALNTSGFDELARSSLAANDLVALYASLVAQTLKQTKLLASQVSAIGAHGQTVRHQPNLGYTIQLNEASDISHGKSAGHSTRQNARHGVAPKVRAAAMRDALTCSKPSVAARTKTHKLKKTLPYKSK